MSAETGVSKATIDSMLEQGISGDQMNGSSFNCISGGVLPCYRSIEKQNSRSFWYLMIVSRN
jgi:hypothetical protein